MRKILFFLSLVLGLSAAACERINNDLPVGKIEEKIESMGPILVKADEEVLVTLDDFNHMIEEIPAYGKKIETKEEKLRQLDKVIDEALLLREARKRGLDQDKEIQGKVEQYRKKLIIDKLYRQVAEEQVEISEEEIAEYYEENKEQFANQERIRVSQILILAPPNAGEEKMAQARAKAEEAYEKAKAGEDFTELVKQYSEGPNAEREGDIGFFQKGRMFPEFDRAAFSLKEVGDISDIVKTHFGFHLLKLTGREPYRQLELKEVRNRILKRLKPKKQRELRNSLAQQLKEGAKIEIFEDLL